MSRNGEADGKAKAEHNDFPTPPELHATTVRSR